MYEYPPANGKTNHVTMVNAEPISKPQASYACHEPAPTQTAMVTTQNTKGIKACTNCGITTTSAWRRTKDIRALVCNSCGDYYKRNGRHRRVKNVAAAQPLPAEQPQQQQVQQPPPQQKQVQGRRTTGPLEQPTVLEALAKACSNCKSRITPTWRRDDGGALLCNACGLYYRNVGRPRPIHPAPQPEDTAGQQQGKNQQKPATSVQHIRDKEGVPRQPASKKHRASKAQNGVIPTDKAGASAYVFRWEDDSWQGG